MPALGSGTADARLRIVSHFPGRLRVRAKRFRDGELARDVAAKLREEAGVRAALATPFTGSVLVEYDARQVQLPWLVQLIVKLGDLEGLEVDHDGKPARPQGPIIKGALGRWNTAMIEASRGRVDAKTAIPGTLAGLGILRFALGNRRLPEWYDLLFWSFVTFMNFNVLPHEPERDGEAS
jgi:hypothetical protein